ncbi:hypothetical protein CWI38_0201p0040 [Hamiltosporidium tvaerminnensis]|uniref:Uncharacterized protein n=1 Tax=Hamiltosporidium tvaerminnensis TaxID=1176355 RepID=A0A4Q9LZP5_9MICR|nr:hypothetical protein CWI38_0201p0040 [Hamiltosporidium tvaerminnensis]
MVLLCGKKKKETIIKVKNKKYEENTSIKVHRSKTLGGNFENIALCWSYSEDEIIDTYPDICNFFHTVDRDRIERVQQTIKNCEDNLVTYDNYFIPEVSEYHLTFSIV